MKLNCRNRRQVIALAFAGFVFGYVLLNRSFMQHQPFRNEISPLHQHTNVESMLNDWSSSYNSEKCSNMRLEPPGTHENGNVGQGQRAKCTNLKSIEFATEIEPSFDISLLHNVIYFPVMKAGTQMFQEVFRKRFKGKRIYGQRALTDFLSKHNKKIDDFFIFSFVRDPFRMFVSGYEEVSKYVMNNRTRVRGFGDVPLLDEPARALTCLNNIQNGLFHGLVPAHLYPQIWKLQRCGMKLNFIGKIENVDHDWRFVEQQLNIPHKDLPVIHAAVSISGDAAQMTSKKILGKFEESPKFSSLTLKVCQYYQADFACFNYDDSPCKVFANED